ncbi:MAG: transglycosylase SLT domain-containing protein [Gammaproteobacteria bacterium]|nr:transglycosylase SLT domain-containing protein [Gammaproteobacteria bacterium]
MTRILTTTTVFCNRPLPVFPCLSDHVNARGATSIARPFALCVLTLGLAGCVTVEPPSEVNRSEDVSVEEEPVEDTPADATVDVLVPTDTVVTPTEAASPASPQIPSQSPKAPEPSPAESVPSEVPDSPPIGKPATPGFLDRLRASFRLDHSLDRKGVANEIGWVARRPDRLARRDRLLEYLPYLCEKVWDREMPGEICLLPIVESRLDPFAFSPGGAVGLWQFIPATAKRFGLKIDWWVDERRDVVLATDAALNYLEVLHDRFGDWLLALAAYNWGEGRVSRALRRSGPDAGFFDIKVPRETVRYVDRLLAYSALFAQPASFGVELPLSNLETTSVAFAVVETGGQVDLARAAEALGCDLDEIYRRNPALNRWATHPEGPHRLLVSAGIESAAQQALAQIPEKERLAWIRHLVVSGETLSEIAVAYRTSVETLQQANRLPGTLIRAGDYLLVPTTRRPLEDYARYSPPLAGRPAGVYVVKAGDTIWDIARLLGLKRRALMNANQIGPDDILRIGQRLSIPN